jgi:hypothetical protein
MTFAETVNELMRLGFTPYQIATALDTSIPHVHRLRRVKSARPPAPEVWRPILYKLARERALSLDTLALRLSL